MIVGTLRLRLLIRDARSLKDKRRVLRALKDRVGDRFRVAVAETGEQDVWKSAELGVATVGSEGRQVQSVLSNVTGYVRLYGGVELVDEEQEIYSDQG